ncbi:phospholipase A2-like [Pezoporus occidentalis]|uniref:phospholipase A2-like n=2 Tax=Pezoporus TaxID=35539 RepID=UPI002F90CC7B
MPFQQPFPPSLPPKGDARQTEPALALPAQQGARYGTHRTRAGLGTSQKRVFRCRRAQSHVYIKPGGGLGRLPKHNRTSARSAAQRLNPGAPERDSDLPMGSRLLLALLLLQAVWKGALGKSHSLHTRGIIELAGAISCGTGRSPLAYIGYGCYCGLGGHGWPKDKTDWCCHRHDCCYDKAEKEGCSPKVQRYQWACEQNAVQCDNLTDRCEKMVCLCDQEAAKCWGAAPYNPHFVLWPDFLCGQTHPTCHFGYGGPE